MKRTASAPLLALALAVSACAGPPATDPRDPWEATNRQIHDFNLRADDAAIRPAAAAYRDTLPEGARTAIRNFLSNLNEPVVFANNVLQFRFLDAGHTLMRFYINTVGGGLGFFDIATPNGLTRRSGDFGQTLHSWGVPDGPFVVLPIMGPTVIRDAIGEGIDAAANPIGLLTGSIFATGTAHIIGAGRGALSGVDLRAENIDTLDALRSDSLDFYARLRSITRQRRDAELGRSGGEGETIVPLDDPGADSAAGAAVPTPMPGTPAAGPAQLPGITVRPPSAGQPDAAWARNMPPGTRF
ncbi:VacJ family lipoprotein [Roseococcus sp. SYP-B2431]|uniref:MlaA family lipoprotein n=1 Tax=Roseococcus sp. SYP-B2431 TaxID=2496640 RepID=UPI0013F42541|nr:VacJ family lipoprotein [Roseococcus sp. SYP-B2431]